MGFEDDSENIEKRILKVIRFTSWGIEGAAEAFIYEVM